MSGDQYKAWLYAGLGLKDVKFGLEDYLHNQIEQCHTSLLQNVSTQLMLASIVNIDWSKQTLIINVTKHKFTPPKFYCQLHSTGDIKQCKKECPNVVCHHLMREIINLHRRKQPIWNNTDINPIKWVTDPWEVAKCFLSVTGQRHIQSIKELDCAGLLSIMINLTPIAQVLNIAEGDIKDEKDVISKVIFF